MRILRVWSPQALETIIITGVLEARCAYFTCLEALYKHGGLGGKVCVFCVLGDPQAPETSVITGVLEAR